MSELKVVSLEECLEKVIDYRGRTPKKLGKDWLKDGEYRAISANNVKFDGLIREESIYRGDEELYKLWMKDEVERGDILLTSEAPSGQAMIWNSDEKIILSQRLYALRVNKNLVDNNYLKYFIQSPIGQKSIVRNNSGSTVSGISAKTFKNIKILIPDLEKQQAISKILLAIDQKIQINNQINQELEAMAKTLYDYWFVQFDFPDQNGNPYKSSGGKMVYHPELKREIPEGWEVSKVGELQITTGKRDANFGTENGKYDFWTTANSPIKADEFSFEGKAILIAGNGNFYVNFTEGKFEAYQRTYVIQSEDENILIFMYMACLQSAEKLRKGSNGSIIKYITIGDVNNIASPYNKKIVDDFVKIYSPLIDLISKNKRQNQELTQLRDWLLPMLMNGQVKVE